MMQFITANKIGTVRREVLQGKSYVVTPVRMIVPGVLTGNRGSLLYREDDIAKSVFAWNNMPIVVNHPKEGDKFISARKPDVLDKVGVGFVFNAKQQNGNLDAEAWIDIEALRTVNSDLASKVENGTPVEVSTGLGTENQPSTGTYNGKNYTHIAKNFAPDHLALLPQEKGACSLDDGCGLSVNSIEADDLETLVKEYNEAGTDLRFSTWLVTNVAKKGGCGCGGGGDKPCSCNGCGGKKKKTTMNADDLEDQEDEQEDTKVTGNSGISWSFDMINNSGSCGAGGGKGRPGFQPNNSCAKGSGRAGFAKAKTATPAQKKTLATREGHKAKKEAKGAHDRLKTKLGTKMGPLMSVLTGADTIGAKQIAKNYGVDEKDVLSLHKVLSSKVYDPNKKFREAQDAKKIQGLPQDKKSLKAMSKDITAKMTSLENKMEDLEAEATKGLKIGSPEYKAAKKKAMNSPEMDKLDSEYAKLEEQSDNIWKAQLALEKQAKQAKFQSIDVDNPKSASSSLVPGGKGRKVLSDGTVQWRQQGGHAGSKKLSDTMKLAAELGYKKVDSNSSNSPDGSYIGSGVVYRHKNGSEIRVSSNYGVTASENSFSISYTPPKTGSKTPTAPKSSTPKKAAPTKSGGSRGAGSTSSLKNLGMKDDQLRIFKDNVQGKASTTEIVDLFTSYTKTGFTDKEYQSLTKTYSRDPKVKQNLINKMIKLAEKQK